MDADHLGMYLGARGARWDPDAQILTCTTCQRRWRYSYRPDWWRCPSGCGDRLDSNPMSQRAARRLNADPPLPYAGMDVPDGVEAPPLGADPDPTARTFTPAGAGAVSARERAHRGGRPLGSGVVSVAEIAQALRERWAAEGRRPTRLAIAEALHISDDTLGDTIQREHARSGTGPRSFSALCELIAAERTEH